MFYILDLIQSIHKGYQPHPLLRKFIGTLFLFNIKHLALIYHSINFIKEKRNKNSEVINARSHINYDRKEYKLSKTKLMYFLEKCFKSLKISVE